MTHLNQNLGKDILMYLQKSSSIDGFANMMIRLFQQTVPGEISLLKQALLHDEKDQVKLILHRLKPTSKLFGQFDLHDMIVSMEESIHQDGLSEKNKSSVKQIIRQFENILSVFTE